jgi:hypothetical protein
MEVLKDMLQTAAQRDPEALRALLVQFSTEASAS